MKYKIADVDEIPRGSRIISEIDGKEIAVFNIDGEYHAALNYCVHQSGPLCEGEMHGRIHAVDGQWEWEYDDTEKVVHCPWHGWAFDVTTGENIHAKQYSVPTFDVTVTDGEIFVTV